MRKILYVLSIAVALGFSGTAAALCSYLNVTSSGGSVLPENVGIVHEFSVSCLGTVTFKLDDLSGNYSSNIVVHTIERLKGGVWDVVSSKRSTGVKTVSISFLPGDTGKYRYRIRNDGKAEVANWRMEGRVPLFTIPGT